MKAELKDVLHLYLGCTVQGTQSKEIAVFNIIDETVIKMVNQNLIKPILRPLSSMTEAEEHEVYTIRGENAFVEFEGETVRHLLSKGFDLFNLIPSGQAIDATTLTPAITSN